MSPFKTIRIKQRTQPWMSTEMIKLINLRDICSYIIETRSNTKGKGQISVLNVVNENKNRPKKLWQILKEVGSSTKCKTKESSIYCLDIGNELCFDKVKVATQFNDFFTCNAASLNCYQTASVFLSVP